jgi:hypothetical protein
VRTANPPHDRFHVVPCTGSPPTPTVHGTWTRSRGISADAWSVKASRARRWPPSMPENLWSLWRPGANQAIHLGLEWAHRAQYRVLSRWNTCGRNQRRRLLDQPTFKTDS